MNDTFTVNSSDDYACYDYYYDNFNLGTCLTGIEAREKNYMDSIDDSYG